MSALPSRTHWASSLFEGADLQRSGVLVQQDRYGWAFVTLCFESSGFSIAEAVPFQHALEIAIEAVARGARLCIEIEMTIAEGPHG